MYKSTYNIAKSVCVLCSATLLGRRDKKFCSDYCRNSFNNQLNKDANNYIRNVNNRLRKNRRILEELNPHGRAHVSKMALQLKGFDFNLITNFQLIETGELYRFCYDQGYFELEEDKFTLLEWGK